MPRIELRDPWGVIFRIDSMSPNVLRAWFDEILPRLWIPSREDIEPTIRIWPMFSPHEKDADWLADSRVIGYPRPFPAHNGAQALDLLAKMREDLGAELETLR